MGAPPTSLLDRPVYGMVQVDWLLALPTGTARRWIDGYTRSGKEYPPIVRVESTGDDIVTWGEFAETRLLSEFRREGRVPISRMRPAVEKLREAFGTVYPLAHASPWLESRGRELVLRMQLDLGLERELQLVVVRNGQLVLTAEAQQYVDSAVFDGQPVVQRLRPYADLGDVFFDPLRQFGEPVVRSVRTAVLAELFRAGDDPEMIADLYELPEEQVLQAIRYEQRRLEQKLAA